MLRWKKLIEEAKTDVNMGPTQTGRMVVLKEMKDSMGKVFIQFDCSSGENQNFRRWILVFTFSKWIFFGPKAIGDDVF